MKKNFSVLESVKKQNLAEAKAKKKEVLTTDLADLTLLAMYHGRYNEHISISDTDVIMNLALAFRKQYPDGDWENSDIDWVTAICEFYNKNAPFNYNRIPMCYDPE